MLGEQNRDFSYEFYCPRQSWRVFFVKYAHRFFRTSRLFFKPISTKFLSRTMKIENHENNYTVYHVYDAMLLKNKYIMKKLILPKIQNILRKLKGRIFLCSQTISRGGIPYTVKDAILIFILQEDGLNFNVSCISIF